MDILDLDLPYSKLWKDGVRQTKGFITNGGYEVWAMCEDLLHDICNWMVGRSKNHLISAQYSQIIPLASRLNLHPYCQTKVQVKSKVKSSPKKTSERSKDLDFAFSMVISPHNHKLFMDIQTFYHHHQVLYLFMETSHEPWLKSKVRKKGKKERKKKEKFSFCLTKSTPV